MKQEISKVYMALADIEADHNHSWYKEIFERNKDNLDSCAIFYRGNHITYREMFENAQNYAKSLKSLGVSKNFEIPCCISNSPQLIYLLIAASMIGAKLNIFGYGFDGNYITEILNNSKSDFMIANENEYRKIKQFVENSNIKKKVIFSLSDSLANNEDPFDFVDSKFAKFENTINELKLYDNQIFNNDDFLAFGKSYMGPIEETCTLDDEFTITYTSGSTNTSKPKAIVHINRSYITMGRFHDDDLSGLPSTREIKTLAHIPPYSNTNLMTCISDSFFQHGTIAVEPIYNKEFFIYSLMINKPNFAPATRSFYINFSKKILYDEEFKDVKMKQLLIPTVVGESLSAGEEKFINKALNKIKAGSSKVPFPISPVKLSFGGGDCEHGGLFFTLFKSTMQQLSLSKEEYGLVPFALANYKILDENGKELPYNTMGCLVSNSPCTMKCYKDNPEATQQFFIRDDKGKLWGNNKVWAYIDKKNNIHIKGRIGNELLLENGEKYPLFNISDAILKDTKNIMSCEVITVIDEFNNNIPVAHIELFPDKYTKINNILLSIEKRIQRVLPAEVVNKLVYRIRTTNESYPLTGSGKRDCIALENEGLEYIINDITKKAEKEKIKQKTIKK